MGLNTSQIGKTIFSLALTITPLVCISSTAVLADPVPVFPDPLRIPLPKVCIDRKLSRDACARLFSEIQDSRIIRDIQIQRVPEIKIPDRCLSCPPISNPNSLPQPVVK